MIRGTRTLVSGNIHFRGERESIFNKKQSEFHIFGNATKKLRIMRRE